MKKVLSAVIGVFTLVVIVGAGYMGYMCLESRFMKYLNSQDNAIKQVIKVSSDNNAQIAVLQKSVDELRAQINNTEPLQEQAEPVSEDAGLSEGSAAEGIGTEAPQTPQAAE